jgi:multidrug resistance protein, MATE family
LPASRRLKRVTMTSLSVPAPHTLSPWRDEARAMLMLAWPLILSNLTMSLIHATDVFLLGKLGPTALAAGALATNLVMSVSIFGMGLLTACAPMIASEIGRKSNSVRDVRRTVRQGLWMAISFCIPVWGILWFAEHIFLSLGQQPELARDAGQMVRTLMWSILPFVGITVLRCFISAKERPVWTLVAGLAGVIVNAVLNYGLILGHFGLPQLGLVGAGIGTSIVNLLMFAMLAIVVIRHRAFRRYRLFGRFWRADWRRYRAIWTLGAPIGLMMGFEASVFTAAVFLMGLISTAAVAAHAVALQIASLTFMVPLGIAQAITVRVGMGYGRRDAEAIQRSGWTGYVVAVGFMALTALLMWLFPRPLIGMFVDGTTPGGAQVIELGVAFLAVAAIFQIVDGAQVAGAGMLRGLHDTTVPMVIALFGYWGIGIGVGAWLAFRAGWGGVGIWAGLATGLGIVAVLMLWRWLLRGRIGLLPDPATARA